MAKPKPADDGRTQKQKFIDAARELGADNDAEAFRRAVRTVAKPPAATGKAPPKKSKR